MSGPPATARTIVFFPESAFGPTNDCVGIGDVLQRRGHRVVFVVEESFAGRLESYGFEERLMRLGPPPAQEEAPGQFWADYIRDTAPEFRKPTIEQLGTFIEPTWRALCDGARYVDERLREIFDELGPDAIVEDNVVAFPAVLTSKRPWVRIVSCQPAELKDAAVPPAFSGYPTGDRAMWPAFRAEYERVHRPLWEEFDAFVRERGAPGLPDGSFAPEFIHPSPYLDLYLYPAEADYQRSVPLGPAWHRLDSSVRSTDAAWALPEELRSGTGQLLYLSLGSLGSADVALMQHLVDVLAATEHRVIVSMGPQADQLRLGPRMTGATFLPQTSILPQVDLVITHGGNNTTTECFYFGKPMIVLPLFWDQYDNAQRVAELGFGARLDTYGFDDVEMTRAIERLLADRGLARRLSDVAARLQARPGTVLAANLIERVARTRASPA
jgi:UDP:flavonoid glycosyltransferase YjiC (YdhE family)